MAASAWKVFERAKFKIGNGTIDLSSNTAFRLSLHQTAASANLRSANDSSVWSSVGSLASGGGWGGAGAARANSQGLSLGQVRWTSDGGSGMKFDVSADPVFTASASILSAVRFAVIRYSVGSTVSGHLLCWAPLSTAEFDVGIGNTLTIQMAATGIFTLA